MENIAVRVLVADDEPLVRAGIVGLLGTDPGIEVVAQAGDGQQALDVLRSRRVDVALLDVRMPGTSGLEALAQARREGLGGRYVFVTTFGEDEYVSQAIVLGADGFVLKAGSPRELLMAVHAAASGGAFFSPAVVRRVLEESQIAGFGQAQQARTLFDRLTAREQDVIRLVGRGCSNAEIAADLFMAEATVKTHMTSILRATGARNRVEVALVAVRASEA
ncbi:response regulator transcription factor [Rhodococcus sovatensis]|uniref:Response regulator transcription factor n=1 Tax=Rhodococcus sovatensis TaxID=1805840 RepID=A0ABZ2PKJ6_9NOCA